MRNYETQPIDSTLFPEVKETRASSRGRGCGWGRSHRHGRDKYIPILMIGRKIPQNLKRIKRKRERDRSSISKYILSM